MSTPSSRSPTYWSRTNILPVSTSYSDRATGSSARTPRSKATTCRTNSGQGFSKVNTDQVNPRTNTDFDADSLGVGQFRVAVDNNRKFSKLETGIPPLGVVGGDTGARVDLNGVYQFSDNLSFSRGAHSFKTGLELLRYGLDRPAANVPLDSLSCCPGGNSLTITRLCLRPTRCIGFSQRIRDPREHLCALAFFA